MSTRTHHDSPKKNRFIGAVQAGQPLTKAAKELGIPKQTASDIWQKFNKMGSTHARPRSRCPPKITNRIKRAVIRDAKSNRRKPLDQIGNSMEPRILASAVRKILDEVGMH
jgi:transposase